MQIFGKRLIKKFILKHTIAKNALENWMNTVESSDWKSHMDLKQTFPSADYVGNAKYVFNIKGNGYRIVAVVIFVGGTLSIRFIGTHEEYNKIDCKNI
ncbi:MAG: type II toxin-antitoxin system HigB family toxin [Candidatus Azobacteroides sp.]|nr:type II toxin-antitoxin system HigB family toxin [Candidatus Azobacteroides sp.]